MKGVLKDDCLSYSTVYTWVSRFKTGHLKVTDESRCGTLNSVTTHDKVAAVYDTVLKDRRISAKIIAENRSISRERVGHVIQNILDMRKLPAKWVPTFLNADQKHT